MNNRFSIPQISYRLAYLLTTVAMAGVWTGVLAIIGLAFGTVLASPTVSVLQAQIFVAVSLPFVGVFTGQGVLTAFLDGYAKGGFTIERPIQSRPNATPSNPWRCGLTLALFVGVPAVVCVVCLLHFLYANQSGLTPLMLAVFLAASGATVAVIGAIWIGGRVFWNEVAVPIPNRLYSDSLRTYIWLRMVVPNGIANLIINGWVAAAIFPRGQPDAASIPFILTDISVTTGLIFLFVSGGAANHVISDRRWGVVTVSNPRNPPSVVLRLAFPFLFAAISGALTLASFSAASITHLDLVPFIFWKALTACAVAGVAARFGVHWGLATDLSIEQIEQ